MMFYVSKGRFFQKIQWAQKICQITIFLRAMEEIYLAVYEFNVGS